MVRFQANHLDQLPDTVILILPRVQLHGPYGLGYNVAYVLPWVQGSIRVLEYHLHFLPVGNHLAVAQSGDVRSLIQNPARSCLVQLKNGAAHRGFAAA